MLHLVADDIDTAVAVFLAEHQTIFFEQKCSDDQLVQLIDVLLGDFVLGIPDEFQALLHPVNTVLALADRGIAGQDPADAVPGSVDVFDAEGG